MHVSTYIVANHVPLLAKLDQFPAKLCGFWLACLRVLEHEKHAYFMSNRALIVLKKGASIAIRYPCLLTHALCPVLWAC